MEQPPSQGSVLLPRALFPSQGPVFPSQGLVSGISGKNNCCHPERTGPQVLFSLGGVSRRICGCSSTDFGLTAPASVPTGPLALQRIAWPWRTIRICTHSIVPLTASRGPPLFPASARPKNRVPYPLTPMGYNLGNTTARRSLISNIATKSTIGKTVNRKVHSCPNFAPYFAENNDFGQKNAVSRS